MARLPDKRGDKRRMEERLSKLGFVLEPFLGEAGRAEVSDVVQTFE
jgi:hypothetical protein